MDIRLIASDDDYEEALAEIRRLWGASPGSAERGRLELLAMLAHCYERQRAPLPDLDPIDALKFRMEQQGLSRRDLLGIFGTSARISGVLNRKRPLTLAMIRRLHTEFDIPLQSLIGSATRRANTTRRRSPRKVRRRAA